MMNTLDYNSYIKYYPNTPPYIYPNEYTYYGTEKQFHTGFSNLQEVAYPQFPTPPLSASPPTVQSEQNNIKNISIPNQLSEKRTKSVIMRVTNKKISEVRNKHSDNEFICLWTNCSRIFESLEGLAAHVTHVHASSSDNGLYYCQWEGCLRTDRGFNARYKMLVHVRTHTKEKPHSCQLCNKSFSRAENLKIHIRSHSGEKPYVCPVAGCNKAYSNSSDRFKHTRTHAVEKPYACKIPGCRKRYTDPSSLRKHVKTFKHITNFNRSIELQVTENQNIISNKQLEDENETITSFGNMPDDIYKRKICSCTAECYDHYRKSEIFNIDGYFNRVFSDYDHQLSPLTATPYWIESERAEICVAKMDVDLPLDLSINRDHR